MEIGIHEITSDLDAALPGFLETFIEEFHAWGREPVPTLVNQIRRSGSANQRERYRHWVATSGNEVAGIVRGAYVPEASCGFVVHIAVRPPFRKSGLARRLISAATSGFQEDAQRLIAPYMGTLFEVERVQDAENDDHFEENRARIAFFTRLGVTRLSASYTQPAMDRWLPPMPLNLFLAPSGEPYERDEVILGFYRGAFGMREDHPFVVRALLDPDAAIDAVTR